jgi:hypothetical protein
MVYIILIDTENALTKAFFRFGKTFLKNLLTNTKTYVIICIVVVIVTHIAKV